MRSGASCVDIKTGYENKLQIETACKNQPFQDCDRERKEREEAEYKYHLCYDVWTGALYSYQEEQKQQYKTMQEHWNQQKSSCT